MIIYEPEFTNSSIVLYGTVRKGLTKDKIGINQALVATAYSVVLWLLLLIGCFNLLVIIVVSIMGFSNFGQLTMRINQS